MLAAAAPWTRRHMASHMFQDGLGQIQLMFRGMSQGMKLTRRFGAGVNMRVRPRAGAEQSEDVIVGV